MDFWNQVKSLFHLARLDGRTYRTQERNEKNEFVWVDAPWLTFEEWDTLFDAAVEAGIMSVHDDGKGQPSARFANPSAMAILALWRAVREARESGMSEMAFARQYDAAMHRACEAARERSNADDRAAAERRERAADDLRARKSDRRGKVVDGKLEASGSW